MLCCVPKHQRVYPGNDQGVALLDVRFHCVGRCTEDPKPNSGITTCFGNVLDSADDFRVVNLADFPQTGREVVRADQYAIDSRYSYDGLDVFDRLYVLCLKVTATFLFAASTYSWNLSP